MANALFPKGKEKFLSGSINLSVDTIKAAALTALTWDTTDEFYSDVNTNVVGTPATLGSKTVTNGVFDAADVTISGIASGTVTRLVIYKDTGVAATSPVIAFFDTGSGGAISVAPGGADLVIAWDSGANKIFAL